MPEEQTRQAKAIIELAVDNVVRSLNIREQGADPEAEAGLTQTVREHGVIQPILVRIRDGKYELIDGGRRLAAAMRAGCKTIPAIVEEGPLSDAQSVLQQLVANCQREDCKPLDKARALRLVIEQTGWTASEVAAKLGFSNATVTRLLALLALPEPIRRQIEAGEVSSSSAYELTHIEDPAKQVEMAAKLARGELTRDGLSGAVKRGRKAAARPGASVSQPARVTALLGGGRSVTVSGSGITLDSFVEWLEELLAKARKARPQGIEINTFVKMLKDQAKA
jgi:ParB family chromosome partitioning protein